MGEPTKENHKIRRYTDGYLEIVFPYKMPFLFHFSLAIYVSEESACIIFLKDKGKAVSLQARCGPEGSRRFRLPDFMSFGT